MRAARAALNKTSNLHLSFKDRMVRSGLGGFVTEGEVGPFSIDESHSDAHLAIEIDGCYWHGCLECGFPGVPSNLRNDRAKNAYLKAAGWEVLRLKGHDVRKNPEMCIQRIQEALLQRGAA